MSKATTIDHASSLQLSLGESLLLTKFALVVSGPVELAPFFGSHMSRLSEMATSRPCDENGFIGTDL